MAVQRHYKRGSGSRRQGGLTKAVRTTRAMPHLCIGLRRRGFYRVHLTAASTGQVGVAADRAYLRRMQPAAMRHRRAFAAASAAASVDIMAFMFLIQLLPLPVLLLLTPLLLVVVDQLPMLWHNKE